MMRPRLSLLVAALLVLALPASAMAAQKVFVAPYLNQGPAQVRPHEVLLTEDGTLSLYAIHYESYGGAVATAAGRGYTRGCVPDCAQGKVLRPRAKIRFSQVTRCEGKLVYARLQYSLMGPIPSGFKRRATYDLRPLDEHGKPVC
jgi:hypothetical protein